MARRPTDTPIVIRDRRPGFFCINNAIVDHYAAQIGPYGLAAYVGLARLINEHGQAWPGYKYLATKLGMSRTGLLSGLKKLEAAGLITAETRLTPDGDYDTRLYTLLPVPEGGGTSERPPDLSDAPGVIFHKHQGDPYECNNSYPLKKTQGKKKRASPPRSRARPTPPRKATAPTLRPFPPDFTVTDRMRSWFRGKGLTIDLDQATEQWALNMQAKGRQYADWRAAWYIGMTRAQGWADERQAAANGHIPQHKPSHAGHGHEVRLYEQGPGCKSCQQPLSDQEYAAVLAWNKASPRLQGAAS